VLANLFLHYAFDAWIAREYPGIQFERYVDDVVVDITEIALQPPPTHLTAFPVIHPLPATEYRVRFPTDTACVSDRRPFPISDLWTPSVLRARRRRIHLTCVNPPSEPAIRRSHWLGESRMQCE
jgi:hypothetical protein